MLGSALPQLMARVGAQAGFVRVRTLGLLQSTESAVGPRSHAKNLRLGCCLRKLPLFFLPHRCSKRDMG